jgi:hypothetical protein
MRFLIFLFFVPFFSFATWDDVIQQEEQQAENEKIKTINENFKLEKFATSDQFEDVLIDKLYDKIIKSCSYNIFPQPVPMYRAL